MKNTATPPVKPTIPTLDKSRDIARLLDEKQGEDILVLDVSGVCSIAENLVLVTARGQRHAQALADAVLALAGERTYLSFGMEGYEKGTWILLDLNDVVVHVFQEDARRFYNLEGLWTEGRRVAWAAADVRPEDVRPEAVQPEAVQPKALPTQDAPQQAAPDAQEGAGE